MPVLTVSFSTPSPVPVNGFQVFYRESGTTTYTQLTPNVFTSPVTITVPDNVEYDGYIICDCGSGVDSTQTNFTAIPCSGLNKKIINGVCTTGTRVNMSTTEITLESYTCAFVWVFSDGSSTPIQSEVNVNPCSLGPVIG